MTNSLRTWKWPFSSLIYPLKMVISHSYVSFPEGKVYHRIGTAKLRCLNFTMKPHIFCSIWPPFGAPACLASRDPSTNQSANSQARSPGFHREKERVLIVIPVIYQVLDGFFLALSPGFINKSWWYQLFYGKNSPAVIKHVATFLPRRAWKSETHRSDWRVFFLGLSWELRYPAW